ncbi:type VI secretion system baseplate subunit TssG [candidate division KSB1 bacterium]|nr:type VI secretion system baseplate subunit TssG [candidate division KSB1 bacterium]
MAAGSGENISRIVEDLTLNYPAYHMFYALYLAEKLIREWYPNLEIEKFDQTGIKIRPYEHHSFYPVSIRGFSYADQQLNFVINLYGLYGPDSPLPRCYHEEVSLQKKMHRDGSPLRDFFDIFNNRFYWLYYQAWKKYRYYLQLTDDPNNKSLQRILTFIGLGPDFVKEKPTVNVYRLMQLSGILSSRIRNKQGLLILLREFWRQFNFQIKEFVPGMVLVAERPVLSSKSGDRALKLGGFSLVGERICDYMSRICLEIGPMNFSDYLEFLPDGASIKLLNELLQLYLNDKLEFDIKCIIRAETIKPMRLSDKQVRLGQSIWLGTPKTDDVEVELKYEQMRSQ